MLDGLKNYWHELKRGHPGDRFQQQYEKKHESGSRPVRKVLFIGGGVLVIAAGLFFLPAPGPGWAVIFIGAGLLAQEWLAAAKLLDWTELRILVVIQWAQRIWKQSPTWARVWYIIIGVTVIAAALYGAYLLFFKK